MAIPTAPFAASTNSQTADTGATIEIERPPGDAAIVRVTYPGDRRRRSLAILKITCTVLSLLPVIAWVVFRPRSTGWFAVIAAAVCAIGVMINLIRQFSAITRSYLFRADRSGLIIETSDGHRSTTRHLAPNQIADIVLGFSFHQGPYSLFRCWLVIETPLSPKIRCLQDLGGIHLARVADALRAGLGMPPRSWP